MRAGARPATVALSSSPHAGGTQLHEIRDLALAAATAASDKQATDVRVLDVSERLPLTDYFVICSVGSDRQAKAVADEIERVCREQGSRSPRREGERDATWLLLDFGDIVVHVFHDEARDYYGLERLWQDAELVARSNEVGDLVTV